jgi:hypothetical protein
MTMPRCRRSSKPARAIAIAFAIAFAGCVTVPPPPRFKPADAKDAKAYKFTMAFTGSPECTISATPDWANCNTNLDANSRGQPRDCTWIPYDATVEFAGPAERKFELQFDPFGKSSISVSGTSGPLSIARDTSKPKGTNRHHVFRVTAAGCKPLDPEIIVNW